MLKKIGILLFFISITSIQTIFAPMFSIFGVKPDLILIVVVAWGVSRGPVEGGVVGVVGGIIEDILASSFYLHALTKAFAGFFSGIIRGNFAVASNFMYAITVCAMTFLTYLINIIAFYFFFGRALPSFLSIISVMVIASVYNGLLSYVLCPVAVAIMERLSSYDASSVKEYKLYRI